jgi:hypothetical protein
MLYSPLDTALLLILLQSSSDGYFLLCSSKSSFGDLEANEDGQGKFIEREEKGVKEGRRRKK